MCVVPDERVLFGEDQDIVAPGRYDGRETIEARKMEPVFCDEMGVNKIGPDLLYESFYLEMAGDIGEIQVIPGRWNDMLGDTVDGTSHWIIRDEMDVMPSVCKIRRPALGVDAAGVSNEEEDQGMTTPSNSKSEY